MACALIAHGQPPSVEKQAEQLLNSAQKAYNEGNPKAAADQFAEFLQKYNGQKGTNAAKYGQALALLDLPERDYQKAFDLLAAPLSEGSFTDRPLAIYYSAVCLRGLALKDLEAGQKNPADAARLRDAALPRLTESARLFGRAAEVFGQRKAEGDGEWVARSLCDKAEMELRINKPKDARSSVEPFVKDANFAKSKSRPLGLYYHGFASFLLNDIPAAGKSLGLVAPFDQPYGPHARYLLGRVHQASEENAEAAAAFDAVIAGYEKQKKDAAEALKNVAQFRNDPWELARLQALVNSPPPDYVAGASFYSACLNYEAGKFAEALPKFLAFAKDFATSHFAADAMLRAGYCMVQLKQFDEAVKVLKPLADQQRRLSDQAMYWLGKAQLGQSQAIDTNNKPARQQALQTALTTLRAAADRSTELAGQDPTANDRRVEILVDISDALLAGGQTKEAAEACMTAFKAKPNAAREQEILQRTVAAFQIAGDHTNTTYWGGIFKQKYPQSPLIPEILFREAESLHSRALQLTNSKDPLGKDVYAKALAAYESLIAKYPEFDRVNRARYGLAVCLTELGDWEKAATVLETIPQADRVGDAAAASFLLADCQIRTAPAKADDALADNMLREKLGTAIGLLESFVAANPKAAETPESLLKLGYCYKRLGIQLAEPKEKNEAFNKARVALDRVQKEYAGAPVLGQAVLERAKIRQIQGDKNGAAADLRTFTQEPLAHDAIAPLALIAYATLLREQNQAPAAVAMLKEARAKYEPSLIGDKAEWLQLLRYHHGVTMMEAGQFLDARATLESVAAATSGKPMCAEAVLMCEMAHLADIRKRLDEAEKDRQKPGLKQEQIEEADRKIRGLRTNLVEEAKNMQRRSEALKGTLPTHEARGRLQYEAAWIYRSLSPFTPLNPNGRPFTDADRDAKEPYPSPKEMLDLARAAYSHVITDFADLFLAVEARFELAEIENDTGNADVAIKLLKEAIEKEPTDRPTTPELAERLRFRLGVALFDRKEYDAARSQFDVIAQNAKSPLRGQAMYRAAECLLAQKKFEDAKNLLKLFRDDAAFQHVPNVSDRALLRLGHAYAELKSMDSSRQCFEVLLARYGNSPWAAEARYGMGWAYANQHKHDEAVNQFTQVTAMKADELAGKAHLQIGLCRAAQKKYGEAVKAFMTVAYGYDAPDLRFAALLEGARALDEDKKSDEALKLLQKLIADAPADSEWHKAAKERLEKVKK